MRETTFSGWLLLCCSAALCQTPNAALTFEAASVKPAADRATSGLSLFAQMRGGPGTQSPGQINYTGVTLNALILKAYATSNYRLFGPGWLETERYDIVAKVPEGTTKEQLNVMLQGLLKERFNLAFHYEAREFAVYDLVVSKGGSKLQAAEPPNSDPPPPAGQRPDENGFFKLRAGYPNIIGIFKGPQVSVSACMQTMPEIAHALEGYARRVVVDKTQLTGAYDFRLGFSRAGAPSVRTDDASDPAPDLSEAVQAQLGLKLEPKKDAVDCMVIDHVDKIPTDN